MEEQDWIVLGIAGVAVLGALLAWLIVNARAKRVIPAAMPAPMGLVPLGATVESEGAIVHVPRVFFGDILRLYESRRRKIDEWSNRLASDLRNARAQSFESMMPTAILCSATREERANLCVLLAIPDTSEANVIETAIRCAGSHSISTAARMAAGKDKYVPYVEVAGDVAKKCGGKILPDMSEAELEQLAVSAALTKMLQKATTEQRDKILKELAEAQRQSAKGEAKVAGALVLANLSGFALYVTASTILGGITGALGIALPFAAYTGLSSLISVVTGPIGWTVLGAWTAFKLGGVNYKKTMASVFMIGAVRGRLIGERDERIAKLVHERDVDLKGAVNQLEPFHRYVEKRRTTTREDERVPVSEIPP